VFFGLLWQQFGIHVATTVFFVALVASIAGSAFVLGGRNRRAISPAA
jgi:hypothetical protein